jgi:catechol 2,3-dioxygenase-like lactoylglutathione lyase family enzyme
VIDPRCGYRGSVYPKTLLEVVGMPTFEAVAHLSLTVTDPERSADFYNRVLGTETVMSTVDDVGPVTIVAGPTLMIGLRQHAGTAEADTFDPTRVGLDHVALQVRSQDELEAWRDALDELGVTYSEIVESAFGLHLNLKDPDNIPLELFVPNQP